MYELIIIKDLIIGWSYFMTLGNFHNIKFRNE